MRRGIFRAAGIAAAAAIALAGVAIAQDPNDDIEAYVRSLIQDMATEEGEDLSGEIETAELSVGETADFTFSIDPDAVLYVYGACDDDCTDVDLYAYDEDGEEFESDTLEDDAPMLLILPGDAGEEITLTVELLNCETESCVVGVGIFVAGQ